MKAVALMKAKGAGGGKIHLLAAPYGGHKGGKDSHGEYFTPSTNFMKGLIPYPPVFYFHDMYGDNAVGAPTSRWDDERGEWFEIELDPRHPRFERLTKAAEAGHLYGSTGVVPASRRVSPTGEITRWLIGEISLIDADPSLGREPANYYAMAQPAVERVTSLVKMAPGQLTDNSFMDSASGMQPPAPQNNAMLEGIDSIMMNLLKQIQAWFRVKTSSVGSDPGMGTPLAAPVMGVSTNNDTGGQGMSGAPPQGTAGIGESKIPGAGEVTKPGAEGKDPTKGRVEAGTQTDALAEGTDPDDDGDGGESGDTDPADDSKEDSKMEDKKAALTKANAALAQANAMLAKVNGEVRAKEATNTASDAVRAGRVPPAMQDLYVKLLVACGEADSMTKDGSAKLTDMVKAFVEGLPSLSTGNHDIKAAWVLGTDGKNPSEVDDEYLARMKGYAGIAAAKQEAK